MTNARVLGLLLAVVPWAACDNGPSGTGDAGDEADVLPDADDDANDSGDTTAEDAHDPGYDPFALTSVRPGHGSFQGGTRVDIRGRGFAGTATVFFGEHMTQPADTVVVSDNEIVTVTPAGDVGPTDVRIVQGDDETVLEGGYVYDAIAISPASGAIAGGTFVTIVGSATEFADGDTVLFNTRPAVDVEVVGATVITCRTPPGSIGSADVTVHGAAEDITIRDGFDYFATVDPINGGLGGGPIAGGTPATLCPGSDGDSKGGFFKDGVGTVNVTVLNAMTGDAVPEAFVILGVDIGTSYRGLTDDRGMIVFSGPDLSGRQTVSAAKDGFETTTIEQFDATNVTIFLQPIPDPSPGPMPPGRYGATISGEVIVESTPEFACQPWNLVPEPAAGERKATFMFVTSWDIWNEPPPPGTGSVHARVLEGDTMGSRGYRYSVFSRPGTVAVIALAGLERLSDGAFTPYGMGVARHIIAGPGETVEDIDVCVNHPMDVSLEIDLVDPPAVTSSGAPNTYRVDAFLDLGGDGVFWSPLRTRYMTDAALPLVFPGWVAPNGDLADATYTIVAGAYNRTIDSEGVLNDLNPFSVVISSGHRNVFDPLVVDRFIGIPYAVDPTFGAVVRDNRMSFGHPPAAPDFWLVLLQTYPDQAPLWRIVLPGCLTEYELPDIAALAGLPELPSGYSVWIVWGIRAPGFVYDGWSYRYLYQGYWSAYTADVFIFMFRE